MQTPKSTDWVPAIPCFLFTAVIATYAAVLDVPGVLRIVMVFVAAVLLGLGGALVGRSMRANGWRPGTGPDSGARLWRPSDDIRRADDIRQTSDIRQTGADDHDGQGKQ